MNFIYIIRLLTLLCMKFDFVIDDADLDILYGLIKIISLFDSFFCSISLYSSCIFQILLLMYWFPHLLYVSNLSANILWIWYIWSSILLWIRYCRSSDISRMFIAFIVLLLMLAFRIVSFIFLIVVLVSPAIFIISCTCFCTSIITSNPFNILWYNLVQSSRFFLNILTLSILLSCLEI